MKTGKEIAEETFPKHIYISSYIRNVLEGRIKEICEEAFNAGGLKGYFDEEKELCKQEYEYYCFNDWWELTKQN